MCECDTEHVNFPISCGVWVAPDEQIHLCTHLNEEGKCQIGGYQFKCGHVDELKYYMYGEQAVDPLTVGTQMHQRIYDALDSVNYTLEALDRHGKQRAKEMVIPDMDFGKVEARCLAAVSGRVYEDAETVFKEQVTAPKNVEQEGKPDLTLLPMDLLNEFLTPAYMEGLQKYYRESWRKGFKVSTMFAAGKRHGDSFFYDGEDLDPEALAKFGIPKHHIAARIFSDLCILHTLKHHPHLDDRRDPATGELRNKQSGTGEEHF